MAHINNSDSELKYVILRDINGTPSSEPTSFLAKYRDINRAGVLIQELTKNSCLEIIDGKIKVTPKGKKLKKELYEKREEDKRKQYLSKYETILSKRIPLNPIHRELLEKAKNKECAALIIADETLGNPGNLSWKLEVCPTYNDDYTDTYYLFSKLNIQAELDNLKNSNIDKYEISALINKDTCDKCKKMNGKKFRVSEAKIGINCPPFHEKCRCSILASLPTEKELDEEFEKFKSKYVPKGKSFNDWVDSLEPTKDGKLIQKNKKSLFKRLFSKK